MSKSILALALLGSLLTSSTSDAQETKPLTILFEPNIEQSIDRIRTVIVRDRAGKRRTLSVICVWDKIYVASEGQFYALNAAAMRRASSTKFLSGGETSSVSGDPPAFFRDMASLSRLCAA